MNENVSDKMRLEPRVSSLETEVKSLRTDIASLSDSLRHFVDQIHRDVGSLGRTNWGTIISAVGLAVVIIGAIGTAYISPISGEIKSLHAISNLRIDELKASFDRGVTERERHSTRISELNTEMRGLSETFREVETQFRWGTDVQNVRDRNFDRLISIIWNKVFGTEIPPPSLPSAGPSHNGKVNN